MSLWRIMDDTQCFFHNESVGDDVTPVPDRIMEKTGFCSSGGQGSQDSTATEWQHTTNPAEKQNHNELLQTSYGVSFFAMIGAQERFPPLLPHND